MMQAKPAGTTVQHPQCSRMQNRTNTVRRMARAATFCMAMTLAASVTHAQPVYRIVGPDGKVTFSDKPPTTATKATGLDATAGQAAGNTTPLPYDLRQVVAKYPATLYTAKDCAPCDSGRSLLQARGVPFSEKTITTAQDSEALQRISGSTSLPFLSLGGQQIKGFSDAEWTQYLSAAGYPEKNQLPASYRNPSATPLVAVQGPAAPAAQASSTPIASPPTTPSAPLRVNPANPAGIQF